VEHKPSFDLLVGDHNRHLRRASRDSRSPTVKGMRAVDLALYADELAARAATLAAQLERARGRLRRAAIEREARRTLDEGLIERLEALGFLSCPDPKAARAEVTELAAALRALEDLQAWVERRLYAEREGLSLRAE
jgi:hypothetical protein